MSVWHAPCDPTRPRPAPPAPPAKTKEAEMEPPPDEATRGIAVVDEKEGEEVEAAALAPALAYEQDVDGTLRSPEHQEAAADGRRHPVLSLRARTRSLPPPHSTTLAVSLLAAASCRGDDGDSGGGSVPLLMIAPVLCCGGEMCREGCLMSIVNTMRFGD